MVLPSPHPPLPHPTHKGPGSEQIAAQHGLVCIQCKMHVYVNSAHGLNNSAKESGINYKTRHNGVIGSLDLSHRNFTWKQKNPQAPHS